RDLKGGGRKLTEVSATDVAANRIPARVESADPAGISRRALGIRPRTLKWVWEGVIPRGKLTVLAGDSGSGKSLVALDVIARLTRGILLPSGRESPLPLPARLPVHQNDDGIPGNEQSAQRANGVPILNPSHIANKPPAAGVALLYALASEVEDTILPRLK